MKNGIVFILRPYQVIAKSLSKQTILYIESTGNDKDKALHREPVLDVLFKLTC